MSFGASPSDIIIVVTFCKNLYRKCRDAGGEYDEISREVRGLHTVLKHLKYEVEAPDSPLNRDHSIWSRQLAPIVGDCDYTLRQLDGVLQKYGRLGSDGGSSPSSPRMLWDKVKFGSNEMDQLGATRVKLISHKTSLTLFLDTIQLHQSGKMSTTLDNHGGQLDVILDKVDSIAARMGQKSGSVMTSYDDDDKEVWKQFRRELVSEGFSSSVLQQHKDVLRAYIREIDQQGLLDETAPSGQVKGPSQGINPERWLESVKTGSTMDPPPSFDSLDTGTDDSGAKEMVIREDNMKFPQSMKLERPNPESRRGLAPEINVPTERSLVPTAGPRTSGERQPSPVPMITASDDKEIQYYNTSGSSGEDSEADNSSKRVVSLKRPKSSSKGEIIRTSDLLALSQALQVRPSGLPSSFRSQSSFGEEDVRRSIAYRPREQIDFGSSPPRSGAIPIPSANPRSSGERFSTSPRPDPLRLAPDSFGNEIPSDAKWTKIARHLVSPVVLDQDRRRYEARPDFVAVLGLLSREEIEDYAVRSQLLRSARSRRNQPPPSSSPNLRPIPRSPERRSGHDTPSNSDSDTSDSDHRKQHHRSKASRSYTPSDISSTTPRSGYPNPFGAPISPPSSVSQPVWTPEPPREKSSLSGNYMPSPSPNQRDTYHPPKDRDEKRESSHSHHASKDREPSRRHHRSSSRQSHTHSKSSQKKEVPRSRWKEYGAAAGIGGAAASLMNVLVEAAEGL